MINNKVCVVTGSSSGIGAATVELFATNGWHVAINYSRNEAPAQQVASACRAKGVEVLVHRADVAIDQDCRELAAAVEKRWGRCDALVNNAGTTRFVEPNNLDGLSAEDFLKIYQVNVIGPFQMTRAFAPLMRLNPGAGIVNVSSIASMLGRGSSIAYAASKGGLNTLTVSLARTLGPEIRVNAVAPGMIDSSWLREGLGVDRFNAQSQNYAAKAALSDLIQPQEVAEAIFWLAAGASKTTGEIMTVDSGFKIGKI
ncbi:MAG: SDR family oxidoreductase [Quisquiliibacterium sp.]